MIPILFNYNATTFTTHGIGDLMETLRCESVVNAEGEYELELDYPAGGEFISSLVINNIIYAKVNDHGNWQAFRIYGIDKAINNLVTVHAQHISYDLAGVVVKAYETTTCSSAIAGLKTNAVGTGANAYTIATDIPNSQQALNQDHKFKLDEPVTLRAALLDGDDSIFGCWEGDLVFDNYTIKFLKPGSTDADAGKDRGVLVEYGIDLMDMDQEESISQMITGVYPYWKGKQNDDDASSDEVIVYGSIQYASGTFQKHRVVPLNVTEYYPNNTSAPTVAQINQTAQEWIVANKIGEPQINLKLSYAELGKDVRLHDAITVRFVNIGVDVGAKVVSYKYDTLKERCVEVEVGNVKPSILFSLEDASRLKRGLIPPQRIQNNSITAEKIGNAAVGNSHLGSSSVGTSKIEDAAVVTRKLEDYAVTNSKIGGGAVSTAKIADSAVTTGKIGGGAVTTAKIADNAVTTPKVDHWAITTDKLGDLQVTTAKVNNGAVTSGKISDNAVITGKIAEGAVVEAKIGQSAITSVKIKDGAVIDGKIGNYAVNYENVKDAEIDQLKLNDFSITSEKVSEGGWHTNPDGTRTWVAQPAIGTDSIQGSAIVTAKIGNYQVATVKLVQTAQDAIAAVWEIQALTADYASIKSLVTNNINTGGLSSGYGYIGNAYIPNGLVVGGSLSLNGNYFSKIAIDTSSGYTYYAWG